MTYAIEALGLLLLAAGLYLTVGLGWSLVVLGLLLLGASATATRARDGGA